MARPVQSREEQSVDRIHRSELPVSSITTSSWFPILELNEMKVLKGSSKRELLDMESVSCLGAACKLCVRKPVVHRRSAH